MSVRDVETNVILQQEAAEDESMSDQSNENHADPPSMYNMCNKKMGIGGLLVSILMGTAVGVHMILQGPAPSHLGANSHDLHPDAYSDDSAEPMSALDFLHSDQAVRLLSEAAAYFHPKCTGSDLASSPQCDPGVFKSAVKRHLQTWNEKNPYTAGMLTKADISSQSRQTVMQGAAHFKDPTLHALARDARSTVNNCASNEPQSAIQKITQKLESSESDIKNLRAKLFPGIPLAGDEEVKTVVQTVFPMLECDGIHVGMSPSSASDGWEWDIKATYPTRSEGEQDPATMSGGRGYGEDEGEDGGEGGGRRLQYNPEPGLFAECDSTPCKKGAPRDGLPPPDDFAGDVIGAIYIFPLSHLIMCSLHHEGKITLPYWAKILYTVEDSLTLSAPDIPLIGLILDLCFMWTPRGYHYAEGRGDDYEKFMPGFLGPTLQQELSNSSAK